MESPQEKTMWRKVAESVITSIAVGVLVGMLTAYLTVQELVAQADSNSQRIAKLEERHEKDDQAQADLRERMVRLETKIDLLLGGKVER